LRHSADNGEQVLSLSVQKERVTSRFKI